MQGAQRESGNNGIALPSYSSMVVDGNNAMEDQRDSLLDDKPRCLGIRVAGLEESS